MDDFEMLSSINRYCYERALNRAGHINTLGYIYLPYVAPPAFLGCPYLTNYFSRPCPIPISTGRPKLPLRRGCRRSNAHWLHWRGRVHPLFCLVRSFDSISEACDPLDSPGCSPLAAPSTLRRVIRFLCWVCLGLSVFCALPKSNGCLGFLVLPCSRYLSGCSN